jgi:hypothetical protein
MILEVIMINTAHANVKRAFIQDIVIDAAELAGAKPARLAELRIMVWSGRWDSLFLVSSKEMILTMIERDLGHRAEYDDMTMVSCEIG